MNESKDGEQSVPGALGALRDQLAHLEKLVQPEVHAVRDVGGMLKPAWLKATEGENRLPVAAAIAAAIALQLVLPAHLVFKPTWLLPGLEAALLVGLVIANPKRINRSSALLRVASLALIAAISLANLWSAGHLIRGLIRHTDLSDAGTLLANGAAIYVTNIVSFGLWYWEFDRGGPVARAQAQRAYPDFLFPQMSSPELASPNWAPNFIDYLYVSFTNATAFSPTDTMPLSRWAKLLMGVQSAVSLATVGLVIARAINILK
jgi:hypothetical protein